MVDWVRRFRSAVFALSTAAAALLLPGCGPEGLGPMDGGEEAPLTGEETGQLMDVVGDELEKPGGRTDMVDEAGRLLPESEAPGVEGAGAPPEEDPVMSRPAGATAGSLDADGVKMLATPKAYGVSWRLGTQNPNNISLSYFQLWGAPATRRTEGNLSFWTTTGRLVTYANDQPDGRTARFYMRPSDGSQKYKWNTGAATYGYLASSKDPKNFEATAYVRVRSSLGSHISFSWILRGGAHGSDGDLASASGMQIPYSGQTAKAYRELTHPYYDYVYPGAKFSYTFRAGQWLATKVVSWVVTGGTMNRLYVDPSPFDAYGKPRNNFQLLLEWNDKNGVDTGRYTRAPTWGGYQTSLRIDGFAYTDFAILSVREIVPPG